VRFHFSSLLAAAVAVMLLTTGVQAVPSDDELFPDEQHRLQESQKEFKGGVKAGSAFNMVLVGHNDLGGRGFNADVWVHRRFAYVGHWGFTDWSTGSTRFCPEDPNNGVAVVDIRDPASPVMVSRLVNPEGTSAEDVVVFTARYGPLQGHDIAAAGIQVCGGSRYDTTFPRGLMLWDVTSPATPVQLGFFDTGCCTRGLHEFEVEHRDDLGRTFAYVTVPSSRAPDPNTQSGVSDADGKDGDFRLIDISDPRNPFQASTWWVQLAGGPFAAQGCDPDGNYGHGAEPSDDGKIVFLSYWDSGFIALDLSDPENPAFEGRTIYPADADGDGHSASYDDDRKLLFTADEDFCKTSGSGIEKGFGFLRVFDYSDMSAPVQIGKFGTPNSAGTSDPGAGDFTIHNPLFVNGRIYASWYSDGVRVIDVSDPTAPREIAFFVPPAAENPVKPSQRFVLPNTTQDWGVAWDEATGNVVISDMNTGLWILHVTV
jgi:hypothetical protein